MTDLPGWHNVRPDPQDDESPLWCRRHRVDYFDECPECARRAVKKKAAMLGLSIQLKRLTNHNAVDKADLVTDIKRALEFLRNQT